MSGGGHVHQKPCQFFFTRKCLIFFICVQVHNWLSDRSDQIIMDSQKQAHCTKISQKKKCQFFSKEMFSLFYLCLKIHNRVSDQIIVYSQKQSGSTKKIQKKNCTVVLIQNHSKLLSQWFLLVLFLCTLLMFIGTKLQNLQEIPL